MCCQVKTEIGGNGGSAAIAIGNIGDPQSANLILEIAFDGYTALDIMINNVAARSNLPLSEVDTIDWDRIAKTSLKGLINLSKLRILLMIKRVGVAIVPLAGISLD